MSKKHPMLLIQEAEKVITLAVMLHGGGIVNYRFVYNDSSQYISSYLERDEIMRTLRGPENIEVLSKTVEENEGFLDFTYYEGYGETFRDRIKIIGCKDIVIILQTNKLLVEEFESHSENIDKMFNSFKCK
jgi:hypothetical protein